MSHSILIKFGPILKGLSFFGFFPIQIHTVKDNHLQDVRFQSISPCKLYFKWGFFCFTTYALFGLSLLNMNFHLPEGYSLFDILIHIININPTKLDNYATWTPPIINFSLGYILAANNYRFGKSLVILENTIMEHGPNGINATSLCGIIFPKIIITSLFFGCGACLAFVATVYPAETFDVLTEGYIAFACMTLNIVFHISPMIVFYFIFAIETQNLVNWVRILRTKIGSQDFMHCFGQYVIVLDYAKDAFSFNIFWNILALCSSAIICVFRGANALQYDWNREQYILSVGFWIYACQQSYMLYEFCIRSQNIVEEHEKLLEAIQSNHAYLNKMEEPIMKKMVKRLEKFTGFTALNYFTVNKSLLTSILANFLTYLIVLMQFGMSPSPSDAFVPNFPNSTNTYNTSG